MKLSDMMGNQSVMSSLKAHLKKDSPNRSLLVTGPSGCGKTSIAYCLANELGAYDKKHPDWNFKMLNASDFRGIDTIRQIREDSARRPLNKSPARIWDLEESHRLTSDAQEAILKLLEDPPKDCWFVLTTTEPGKLKMTLRRRCTEFEMSPLSDRELAVLLSKVMKEEGKFVPRDIVAQICRDSMGSPGMALNILDKVIDLPEADMAKAAKRLAERSSNVITLCRAMLALKGGGGKSAWKELAGILKELEEDDEETIRRQVLAYFRKVLLDGDEGAYLVMCEFEQPYYNSGKAGLALSVYRALCLE
jgi:DNA polymerase III delta prime subunit